MNALTKDARGFVQGVVEYLQKDKKSQGSMPKVQSLLYKVTDQAKKEKEAFIRSAVPLTKAEVEGFENALSHLVGHEVSVTTSVDASLVGGVIIQMADWVVDTSFKGQLAQMARSLT